MARSATAVAKPDHTLGWSIALLCTGIVVMAAAGFFHLIDEDFVPYWLLATPVLAGGLAGAAVLRDQRMEHGRRQVWAAGLLFTGLLAVAVALAMIYYVLPF